MEADRARDMDTFHKAGAVLLRNEEQAARARRPRDRSDWLSDETSAFLEEHPDATFDQIMAWLDWLAWPGSPGEDFLAPIEGTAPERLIRYIPYEGCKTDKVIKEDSFRRRVQRLRTVAG